MNNSDKLAAIRTAMPATEAKAYLNTGTCGPMSTVLRQSLDESLAYDFEHGRATGDGFAKMMDSMTDIRARIGRMVHADPSTIALTQHTTNGMNIALFGLNWQAGDELITTTVEHEGGLVPAFILRQRYGVIIRMVDITAADTDAEIVAKLEAAITPRTRALLVSHVAWNLGNRLPLREIAAVCRRHHVLSIVDAAQSFAAIPLDLPALGVDAYAMPGQKWLCGPEGTGALYIRTESLSLFNMSFAGFFSLKTPMDWDFTGHFMPAPGAKRFEVGSIYRPLMHATAANLRWLEEEVGWEWIYGRIAALSTYVYEQLQTIPQVEMVTRAPAESGLNSFFLTGYDTARVVAKLAEENIVIRFLGHPYCLRVSTGFYNSEADIDKLIAALRHITTLAPEELPEFVSPFK